MKHSTALRMVLGGLLMFMLSTQAQAVETTAEPTTEPEGNAETEQLSAQDVYNWIKVNPEYMVMIGMGLVIILLTLTIICILCCYRLDRSESYK